MKSSIMTLRERMWFMLWVARKTLNLKGQESFLVDFYWGVYYRLKESGKPTHEMLDRVEKELSELIKDRRFEK